MRVQALLYMEPWFDIDRYTKAAGVEDSLSDEPQAILYRYRNVAYTGDAAFTVLLDGTFTEELSITTADGVELGSED